MKKILVFSPDTVPAGGALAAGPGIRYYEIAAGLGRAGLDVTLAVPADCLRPVEDELNIVPWDLRGLGDLVSGFDGVVMPQVHGGLSRAYPRVAPEFLPTAVDLYDPVLIENLALQPADAAGTRSFAGYLADVVPILRRGDLFFCANRRQRYYYLGVLNTLGRINPLTFKKPPLITVPFGVDRQPPRHEKHVMRGDFVGEDDPVILWFSGIYPWFDAVTLIKAMPAVLAELPRAKLVIMGGKHPRGHAPDSEYRAASATVDRLGLRDKSVFFVEWRPYQERVNWYLEADVAVATHKQALETEISHRTRVIDFLWAGLPVVISRGDEVGAWLEAAGAGVTVGVGRVDDLAAELLKLLRDKDLRERMSRSARLLAVDLSWDKILAPLIAWARDPQPAADRLSPEARESVLRVVATYDEHAAMEAPRPPAAVAGQRRLPGWAAALKKVVRAARRGGE